jgi:hypothetical protein
LESETPMVETKFIEIPGRLLEDSNQSPDLTHWINPDFIVRIDCKTERGRLGQDGASTPFFRITMVIHMAKGDDITFSARIFRDEASSDQAQAKKIQAIAEAIGLRDPTAVKF